MEEPLHIQWMAKYLAGEMSAQEESVLMAWVAEHEDHRKFFEKTIQLWSLAADLPQATLQVDTASAWSKLESRLDDDETNHSSGGGKLLSIPSWWLRVAAVILVAVGLGYWWYATNTTPQPYAIQTQAGQRMQYQLPDGSQVWLNANTSLSYVDSAGLRYVELEGEAFFDVKRMEDKPFVISSGNARTTVLGTSFNVRAYPGESEVEVTVATGKVQLANAIDGNRQVLLEPGATGLLNKSKGTVKKKEVAAVNTTAWKDQRLDFDGVAFSEVLVALERYFNIKTRVDNENILRCQFYGRYDKPQLDQLLEVISLSMELEVMRKGDTLVLSGAGCE